MILLPMIFNQFEAAQNDNSQCKPDQAQRYLAASEAQSKDRYEPHRASRSDTDDEVIPAQNGSRSDKSHSGKDSEWQAHQIHLHKRIRRFARDRQQEIDLNHRHASGKGDQSHRAQSRGPAMMASVQTNKDAGG
jgi:hypothetical protein